MTYGAGQRRLALSTGNQSPARVVAIDHWMLPAGAPLRHQIDDAGAKLLGGNRSVVITIRGARGECRSSAAVKCRA